MIVATCASLATREHLLRQAFGSIVDQVDAFCVYLNGYQRIPDFLRHPKVLHAVLSIEAGYRAGEAKFWFWDSDQFKAVPAPWDPDTVGITIDDDIIYPRDYVARMVEALDRRPGSIACVHGSVLTEPFVGWRESRRNVHFAEGLEADARIHVPGTGTMAFRARDWTFKLREYEWSHCCDVAAAVYGLRRGIEVWCLSRRPGWLKPLAPPSTGSAVSRQRIMADVDQVETRLIREAGSWPTLPVPAGFVRRARLRRSPARPGERVRRLP